MANSVFYDLAETPEEAANLTARGLVMIAIEQRIGEEGWRQISKFSLDALVNGSHL